MGKHHDLSIGRQLTEIVGKPRRLCVSRRATGIEALYDDEVGDLVIKRANNEELGPCRVRRA
jgi:hypothetical protein